jgi:endonuclease V-like protein UPF0215 family
MKVTNEIGVCKVNGEDVSSVNGPKIYIESCWNSRCWVVIQIDNKEYTVDGSDLQKAISNALNTNWL